MKIGERIRILRKSKRLTIEALASELESNYSTIAMYETNKRKPDYDMLNKIANYFNVSTDFLLGNIKEQPYYQKTKIYDYSDIINKKDSPRIAENEKSFLGRNLLDEEFLTSLSRVKGISIEDAERIVRPIIWFNRIGLEGFGPMESEEIIQRITEEMLSNDSDINKNIAKIILKYSIEHIFEQRPHPNDLPIFLRNLKECIKKFPELENSITDTYKLEFLRNVINLSEARLLDDNDLKLIPVLGIIRAGEPILAEQNIESYFPVDKQFISIAYDYFYLRITGDSMNREFQEGSLVLVQQQNYIESNQIGAVLINGMDATVKKIVTTDNLITLIPCSDDPCYIAQSYDMSKVEVRILGKVVLAVKKY